MDFLLRHLNARGFLTAGVCAALIVLAVKFRAAPGRWYEARMIARDREARAPALDILGDLDVRESQRLKGLYRDVCAELAAARARGERVEELQKAADAAMAMDSRASRAHAFENLNRLRMAIPQPLTALRPAGAADVPSDSPATPTTGTPSARRRRPK